MLQKLYDKYVCPHLINYAMQMKPFRKQREKVIPYASGRVLEIGIGSGLNFNYYNKSINRKKIIFFGVSLYFLQIEVTGILPY